MPCRHGARRRYAGRLPGGKKAHQKICHLGRYCTSHQRGSNRLTSGRRYRSSIRCTTPWSCSVRITRPAAVKFGYCGLDGSIHEAEADGFLAAVIQHEIDQLDGIFWIDRLSRLKRERLLKRFGKLKSVPSR